METEERNEGFRRIVDTNFLSSLSENGWKTAKNDPWNLIAVWMSTRTESKKVCLPKYSNEQGYTTSTVYHK